MDTIELAAGGLILAKACYNLNSAGSKRLVLREKFTKKRFFGLKSNPSRLFLLWSSTYVHAYGLCD
jgi:hypothetical protein